MSLAFLLKVFSEQVSVRLRIPFRQLLCVALIGCATAAEAAPNIASLSPSSGAIGASVTLTGTNFGATQGGSIVKFNGTPAAVSSWTATSIVATVPAGATTGNVTVTVASSPSNGRSFTVLPAPAIASLSPTAAGVGASVTIVGSNFGGSRGSSTVKFNGVAVTTYTSWSATSLVVKVPSGAGSGDVVVRAAAVDSNGLPFTVVPKPIVTGIAPTSAMIGDIVTIAGSNFGSVQGSSTLKFNGTTATPSSWSDTSISTPVPAGATTGNVVISVSGVASDGTTFTVVATPNITSLSPSSGAVGAAVTINGTHFQPVQGSSTITFNGIPATPTSWTATQVKTIVPSGATTGPVVVTAVGLASNEKTFTVKPPPVITSLSSGIGAVGMAVTIAGANFGSTQGSGTVKFNGTLASPASWGPSQIVVPVPSGATTGNVVVRTSGVDSNGLNFVVSTLTGITVTPPNLSLPRKSQQRLTAVGTYATGGTQDLGAIATWSSTDASVATIDASGLMTAAGEGATTIQATFGATTGSTNLTIAGPSPFMRVGSLHSARSRHTATLLDNGKVLIVGGLGGWPTVPTTELYDPATQAFTLSGQLNEFRDSHSATLLPNGKVLIAGGSRYRATGSLTLATAELYDPATGTFTYTGDMRHAQFGHTATLLDNGKVLIAGGFYLGAGGSDLPQAELYDPATGTFELTGPMVTPRSNVVSIRLADGRVLMAGGNYGGYTTASAEVYDPTTGTFTATGDLLAPSISHKAALLTGGAVLVLGGYGNCSGCSSSFRVPEQTYDAVTGTFAVTGSLSLERTGHSATTLTDGTVLVVGGQGSGTNQGAAELFDPTLQRFIGAGSLWARRWGHSATKLNDGSILVAGGTDQHEMVTAELYAPTRPAPHALQITPSTATLRIGDTRDFIVVDSNGLQRDDASWVVNDPNLAEIAGDGTLSLTALAAGTVTLTATIQGVSGQAQISISAQPSHAPGTTDWSLPALSGSPAKQVVQAISSAGPALYAITDDGTRSAVQALTDDGRLLWQSWWPKVNGHSVPDGLGGLLITHHNTCDPGQTEPMKIVNLDPETGDWRWEITASPTYLTITSPPLYCYPQAPRMALRHDGIVAIATPGNTSGLPELMMIDTRTGQVDWAPPIPQSSFRDMSGVNVWGYSRIGPPVVDSDGFIYIAYETRHVERTRVEWATLWLLRIGMDHTTRTTQLTTTTDNLNLFPGRILPDGHGGVVATWTVDQADLSPEPIPLRAAYVTASGGVTEYSFPLQPTLGILKEEGLPIYPTLLLGENDAVFASYGTDLQSFNALSGSLNWSYTAADRMTAIVADAAGGVTAKVTGVGGVETAMHFSATGGVASGGLTGIGLEHAAGAHWLGAAGTDAVAAYIGAYVEPSMSGFAAQKNQNRGQAKPNLIVTPDLAPDPPGQDSIGAILGQLKTKLEAEAAGPKPTCSTWLTNPVNSGLSWSAFLPTYLSDQPTIPNGRMYGHGVFRLDNQVQVDDLIVAARNGVNPNSAVPTGIPMGWFIAMNNNSGYYRSTFLNNSPIVSRKRGYVGGTPRFQAETLIHELAHVFLNANDLPEPHKSSIGFLPDFFDEPAQRANAALIDAKCRAIIESFPK